MSDYSEFVRELPVQVVSEVCGVDVSTVRRWRTGTAQVHPLAEKVLRFVLRGEASELYGQDWQGIQLSKDGLLLPGWRNPIPPGELRAAFWRMQQVESLERSLRACEREKDTARSDQWAAEDRAQWYRRQLLAESRLAFLLAL